VGLSHEAPEWKVAALGKAPTFGIKDSRSILEQRQSLPIYKLKDQLTQAGAGESGVLCISLQHVLPCTVMSDTFQYAIAACSSCTVLVYMAHSCQPCWPLCPMSVMYFHWSVAKLPLNLSTSACAGLH